MSDRRSLSINHNESVQAKMDAIARYIRALTPSDPLFPPPLMPTRAVNADADAYNELELAGQCARLLENHIAEGFVSPEDLKRLYEETEILQRMGVLALTGQVLPRYISDLTAIAEHIGKTLNVKIYAPKGPINLKMPLMVALLYAYEYVEGKR